MIKILKNKRLRRLVIFAAVASFSAVILWHTSHFVIAYQETKHVHIFPREVKATGWNVPDDALTRDLSGTAPFASFTHSNSAYVELDASTTIDLLATTTIKISLPFPNSTLPTTTG